MAGTKDLLGRGRTAPRDFERTHPLEYASGLITATCISFTLSMTILMGVGLAFADDEARRGISMGFGLLAACGGVAILQLVWFTELILRSASYPARLLGFGACAYALLAVAATLRGWFPVGSPGAWLGFTLLFLAILGIAAVGYALHERAVRRRLDAGLAVYRRAWRELEGEEG